MLKHKKSQTTFEFLVAFVFIATLTIVIVYFIFGAQKETESFTEWKPICKASVDANAAMHIKGFDFSSAVECPTNNLVIKGDLRKKEAQEEAKKTIADAMADCWDVFGEGRENLFNGEGIFCSICHIIDFEDPKTEKLDGFERYFYEEKALGRKGLTYSEYITGYTYGEMFSGERKYAVELDSLDTSQPYAVVFYYPKGKDYIKQFSELIGESYPELLVGGGMIATGYGIVKVGAVISATVVGKVIGIPVMVVGSVVGGIGAAIALFSSDGPDEWAAFTFLHPYTNETLKGCTYLPAKQGEWWKIGEKVEV